MKYFIIELTHIGSHEQILNTTSAHREFLQKGYDKGWLLMSGPQNPHQGGIVVCRAPSLEELQQFFLDDPYALGKLATYRFIEFEPVKHTSLIKPWIE